MKRPLALKLRSLWLIVSLVLVVLVAAAIYLYVIKGFDTGFGEYVYPQKFDQYRPAKTLWDWLQLLIVPVILTAGGLWFNTIQHNNDAKHAKTERRLANDRQRETALQAYLDKMTDLLLEHKLGTPEAPEEVKVVARSRTLTTLRTLDADRKGLLVRFLSESKLVGGANLIGADLAGAKLGGANLEAANLEGANLTGADLTGANLDGANLEAANLQGADLHEAVLIYAKLRGTDLSGADLFSADLAGADLEGAKLGGANLRQTVYTTETIWPTGFTPPPEAIED